MYTLLVIDMQEGFLKRFESEEERDRVVHNCRLAVMAAIADGAEIIDVNYRGGYGPTIPEIRHLWRKYKQLGGPVKKAIKAWDGGGNEVMQAEPQGDELLACGINAGACVRSTVFELKEEHDQRVYVLPHAVANSWGGCWGDIDWFERNGLIKS